MNKKFILGNNSNDVLFKDSFPNTKSRRFKTRVSRVLSPFAIYNKKIN